jgi:hypothetical protein
LVSSGYNHGPKHFRMALMLKIIAEIQIVVGAKCIVANKVSAIPNLQTYTLA